MWRIVAVAAAVAVLCGGIWWLPGLFRDKPSEPPTDEVLFAQFESERATFERLVSIAHGWATLDTAFSVAVGASEFQSRMRELGLAYVSRDDLTVRFGCARDGAMGFWDKGYMFSPVSSDWYPRNPDVIVESLDFHESEMGGGYEQELYRPLGTDGWFLYRVVTLNRSE